MGTFKKFVHKIQLEENLYEIKHAVYDSGSCQCFKDCDCIKNKGELEGYSVKYSNMYHLITEIKNLNLKMKVLKKMKVKYENYNCKRWEIFCY